MVGSLHVESYQVNWFGFIGLESTRILIVKEGGSLDTRGRAFAFRNHNAIFHERITGRIRVCSSTTYKH